MHLLHRFFSRSSPSPKCAVYSLHVCNSWTTTCTVQVVQYLAVIPNVTWLAPDGSPLQNVNGITLGQQARNGNITTLPFAIDPLAQSHAGNYTCQACISIDKAAIGGHCGHVVADITLSGKHKLLCSSVFWGFYNCSFFFSSRKGPKPEIYTYLRPVCESTMERAREHQWSYCKLHCTSANL